MELREQQKGKVLEDQRLLPVINIHREKKIFQRAIRILKAKEKKTG